MNYFKKLQLLENYYKFSLISLAFLQVQDFLCTMIGVNRHGMTIEANPIVKFLMEIIGIVPGLLIPKLLALFFIYVIYDIGRYNKMNMALIYSLTILNIFYIWSALRWFMVLNLIPVFLQ